MHDLLECLFGCHCMRTEVGSNPCKKIQLLGIAHPIVGIKILGIKGAPGDGTHPRTQW